MFHTRVSYSRVKHSSSILNRARQTHTTKKIPQTRIPHESRARWKQTSYTNPDPTPCAKPKSLYSSISAKTTNPNLGKSKGTPYFQALREYFSVYKGSKKRRQGLLLPHAFGFRIWFPPSLCFLTCKVGNRVLHTRVPPKT